MTQGKTAATKARFWINQAQVSGDLTEVSISQEAETPDVSTFTSSYRQMLKNSIRTWNANWTGYFNDNNVSGSVGFEQLVKGLIGGSIVMGMFWSGNAASQIGYEGAGVIVGMEVGAPLAGMVTNNATLTGSDWLARTQVIAASIRSASTSGSTSTCSIDLGASTTATIYSVLRMPEGSASTGGSMQATVQHSGDDSTFANLLTFTTVDLSTTGSTFEVKSVTGASRYLRVQYSIGAINAANASPNASAVLFVTAGK